MFLHKRTPVEDVPSAESTIEEARTSSREIVLVVDDDRDLRQVLSELIRDEGLDVATASNGREALDLLTAGLRPMAILLDMMMPIMDGAAFRLAQLTMADVRSIPVAVMSASGACREAIASAFGDVEYVPKPMTGASILSFLGRCRFLPR